jgi:hypothetical protein
MEFKARYLEIDARGLCQFLLLESGQQNRDAVNPSDLLDYLKLRHIAIDFDTSLPEEARSETSRPRALLSFPDRIVATDVRLPDKRARFSVLHEIAHYALPNHQHRLYLCDEAGLGFNARLSLEKEANEFAADLLFQGDRFTLEVNSHPISATTVKSLAGKYKASFEATARRLAERSLRPCMLVVFEAGTDAKINLDLPQTWTNRYSIPSPRFKADYCAAVEGKVPVDVAAALANPGRDIADSETREVGVEGLSGTASLFHAEFFSNTYNIFCLLTPPEA